MKRITAFVAAIVLSILYSQTGDPFDQRMTDQQATAFPCNAQAPCGPRPTVNLVGLFF